MLILATLCFLGLFEGYQSGCGFNYKEMEDLKMEQLEGKWWEYQSFNVRNPIESDGYDCSVFNFYPEKDKINILQDFIRRTSGIVNKDHTRRRWNNFTPYMPAKSLRGYFYGTTWSDAGLLTKYDYSVVNTDYNSWLLVTVCNENTNSRGAYVLTRDQNLTDLQAEELDKKVREAVKNSRSVIAERGTYTTKENSECKSVVFPDTMT